MATGARMATITRRRTVGMIMATDTLGSDAVLTLAQ